MSTALIVVCAVGLLLGLILGGYVVAIYNRFVKLRQRVHNAFSQIDVQLKRRYDLIPNLVETVRGYMTHERETLEAVTKARADAVAASRQAAASPGNPSAVAALAGAENSLLGALGGMLMLREAYPDLRADAQAGRLMEELASTENRIAFARQHYNDTVMTYNAFRQSFPPVLLAGPMGYEPAALFEIDDARERQVVQVSLDKPAPAAGTH